MLTQCRFCEIASRTGLEAGYDRPYVESNEYFAIPSIGGFIEGWSLICPREHILNLRQHYSKDSFQRFVRTVVERINMCYGPVVMFEHGSSCRGSPTSCGTDHGHLHVVPLRTSLVDQLMQSGKQWQQIRASNLSKLPTNDEYLFCTDDVKSEDPMGLVHVLKQPTSQFFRILVARAAQREELSDYRDFPLLPLATKTGAVLAGLIQH